jgi:hypothetical protein
VEPPPVLPNFAIREARIPFPHSPEFVIWEARISAFAMRKNNDMRLEWYFDKLSNHTTALQGRL